MNYNEQLNVAISHMTEASNILFNVSKDMFDKKNYRGLRQDILEAIHSIDDSTELLQELRELF